MKSPALLKMVSALKNKPDYRDVSAKRQAKGMREAFKGIGKAFGGDIKDKKKRPTKSSNEQVVTFKTRYSSKHR